MDALKACLIAFVGWYADVVAWPVVSFLGSIQRRVCGEKTADGSSDCEKMALWTRGIRLYVGLFAGLLMVTHTSRFPFVRVSAFGCLMGAALALEQWTNRWRPAVRLLLFPLAVIAVYLVLPRAR